MIKILYFLFRIMSIILLIIPFLLAIPGFLFILISDEINPDELNKNIKENYDGD
jgi:hypothetical protein